MFDNPLLANELADGARGNLARGPDGLTSVWEAAAQLRPDGLVILAGRNYGAGSSRDWAAKGLRMLGIGAVVAESFERIHRANLIGAGVLPLRFAEGQGRHDLLQGTDDRIEILFPDGLSPHARAEVLSRAGKDRIRRVTAVLDAHSASEIVLLTQGGLLPLIRERFLSTT